jgi:hypothetical protein
VAAAVAVVAAAADEVLAKCGDLLAETVDELEGIELEVALAGAGVARGVDDAFSA